MKRISTLLLAMALAGMMTGCSAGVLFSQKVISSACTMQSGRARVTLTVSAPSQEDLLTSMQIELRYPIQNAAALTGLDLPAQNAQAADLMREAFASQLGLEADAVRCEWNDQEIWLDAGSDEVRGLLHSLGSYPASMKYSDVVATLQSAPEFACS